MTTSEAIGWITQAKDNLESAPIDMRRKAWSMQIRSDEIILLNVKGSAQRKEKAVQRKATHSVKSWQHFLRCTSGRSEWLCV